MASSATQTKEHVAVFLLAHTFSLISIPLRYQNRQVPKIVKFGHLGYQEGMFSASGVMTQDGKFQKEEAAVIL